MRDPRLRPFRGPLAVLGGLLVLQGASAAVLMAGKIGLDPARVRGFYLGSEVARPRSLAGLLEVAVPHLVAAPLLVFVVLHLVALAGVVHPRPFRLLAWAAFGATLAGVASGLAVRYLSPGLAWVKVASFAGFEAVWLVCLVLFAALWSSRASSDAGPGR